MSANEKVFKQVIVKEFSIEGCDKLFYTKNEKENSTKAVGEQFMKIL